MFIQIWIDRCTANAVAGATVRVVAAAGAAVEPKPGAEAPLPVRLPRRKRTCVCVHTSARKVYSKRERRARQTYSRLAQVKVCSSCFLVASISIMMRFLQTSQAMGSNRRVCAQTHQRIPIEFTFHFGRSDVCFCALAAYLCSSSRTSGVIGRKLSCK